MTFYLLKSRHGLSLNNEKIDWSKKMNTENKVQEIERLREECVVCLANKYMERFPKDASDAQKESYKKCVQELLAKAPKTTSAPVVVHAINAEYENIFGSLMDYTDIKKHFNQLMLDLEDEIRDKIINAKEPLKRGIQYALTGNYIDFAALKNVDEKHLLSLLDNVEVQYPLDETEYQHVKSDIIRAKKLVYLTDNCGEIVMDKLLLEVINRLNSSVDITVIVRGGKVFNDATMEDAIQVGLTDFVRVIDNGNQIAGTWLPDCSVEAQSAVNDADVILAKGQANFETLRMCGKNIYYLFLCKCDLFSESFGVPKLTGMLINDQRIKN